MKKLTFLLVVLFITASASAQLDYSKSEGRFEKGSKTITTRVSGLDLNFGNDITNFGLGGKVSYFLINRLSVGAGIDYTYNKSGKGDAKVSTNNFAFEAGVRYYPFSIFYGGAGLHFSKAKGVDMATALKLEIGASYYIADNVFVEPAIFYNAGLSKDTNDRYGLMIGIGVNF